MDVVEAYRTVAPENLAERTQAIARRRGTWITFTSSSTVQNMVDSFGGEIGAEGLRGCRVASIGPVTSATLRGHGIAVTVEAAEYTAAGLVDAILAEVMASASAQPV